MSPVAAATVPPGTYTVPLGTVPSGTSANAMSPNAPLDPSNGVNPGLVTRHRSNANVPHVSSGDCPKRYQSPPAAWYGFTYSSAPGGLVRIVNGTANASRSCPNSGARAELGSSGPLAR